MKRLKQRFLWSMALALSAGVAFLIYWQLQQPEPAPTEAQSTPEVLPGTGFKELSVAAVLALSQDEQMAYLRELIDETREQIRLNRDAVSIREALDRLKTLTFELPAAVAAAVLEAALLDPAARDVSTGLHFSVGAKGFLADPSSLRVAFLDWLGQLAPQQAGVIAQQILSREGSADEWAICLRNYAWANPGARSHPYLREQTRALMNRPDLQAQPTAGYLEAFDVLVFTRSVESTPLLIGLLEDSDEEARATAYAAFLTLDRLVMQQPAEMLRRLNESRALGNIRPEMRAQLMARGDMRDPAIRKEIAHYLLDTQRTQVELEAFAGVFPNHNFMLSDNLLTEVDIPTGVELNQRDLAAYQALQEWMTQERFAGTSEWLEQMRLRLASYLPID